MSMYLDRAACLDPQRAADLARNDALAAESEGPALQPGDLTPEDWEEIDREFAERKASGAQDQDRYQRGMQEQVQEPGMPR